MTSDSQNKVCLKVAKISGYCRHPKNCDEGAVGYSTTGIPKNVSSSVSIIRPIA
jgi:hypothetical protein